MTTTLRPTEPLQRSADGSLSRHYRVCVNSRPVGTAHLATHPEFGSSVALIEDLQIDEADRGRGRGAVAALAAEEVARSWGATRIFARAPAASEHAVRLATSLGYAEQSRVMDKPVAADGLELPSGSRGRPMTEDEYEVWLVQAKEDYARGWIERGIPETAAYAKSERDYARSLPDGLASEGALLTVLEHDGAPVGMCWLGVREADAWVQYVEVDDAHRGRGHGRSLMLLAEADASRAGRDRIGLHVFADNTPAMRLYASLGYRPVLYNLYKGLI